MGDHRDPRAWTLDLLAAVIDGLPGAEAVDPRCAAYARMLAEIYDRHSVLRRVNEDLFGIRSATAAAVEVDPGRRVPNNWDDVLFEPWSARKARLAAERALRRLQAQGLAHG